MTPITKNGTNNQFWYFMDLISKNIFKISVAKNPANMYLYSAFTISSDNLYRKEKVEISKTCILFLIFGKVNKISRKMIRNKLDWHLISDKTEF